MACGDPLTTVVDESPHEIVGAPLEIQFRQLKLDLHVRIEPVGTPPPLPSPNRPHPPATAAEVHNQR